MERKEILLMVLIGFLVLTTSVQAVQLVTLGSSSVTSAAGSSAAPQAVSGAVAAPSSLDNLPSMVGGC
ncbi:hypothetical protein HYX10_04970 [Candidatus Woesearchaeota archaeon]|nr:hypothetical protein [Candidatus Woesearchaeota archaeon]